MPPLVLCGRAGIGERTGIVLGHPAHCPRFGFAPASRFGVRPPQDWPDVAFLALDLTGSASVPQGIVRYPAPSVSVVEPGPVASEFGVGLVPSVPGLIESAGPYEAAFKAYFASTAGLFEQAQSSADAAASVVGVLTADEPAFRVQTSEPAQGLAAIKLADLDGSAVQAFTSRWLS